MQFNLTALEKAVRTGQTTGHLGVRFVGGDDELKPSPLGLETYSIRDGDLTVCVDWINDGFEPLASYCAGIKTALSLPGSVFMSCYASPDGHGFGTHFDPHPSFVLQIEGSKRWRFSAKPALRWPPAILLNARVVPEMVRRYTWAQVRFPDEEDEKTFVEQVLTPGDVLFLPAGTWHNARAVDYSLALTMACSPMTAADFVNDLVRSRLSGSVQWRRDVPPVPMEATRPGRLPPVVKRFFEARLSELREDVQSLRVEDLYQIWVNHVASFDSYFAARDRSGPQDVQVTDTLVLAEDFPVHYVVRQDENSVSLYYLNHCIDLKYDALPLVKKMLRHSTFPARLAVRWLGAGSEWGDVQPVLQELVRAGFLRVDPS